MPNEIFNITFHFLSYMYTYIHNFYEFYFMTLSFGFTSVSLCFAITCQYFFFFSLSILKIYLKATYDWYITCLSVEQKSSSNYLSFVFFSLRLIFSMCFRILVETSIYMKAFHFPCYISELIPLHVSVL